MSILNRLLGRPRDLVADAERSASDNITRSKVSLEAQRAEIEALETQAAKLRARALAELKAGRKRNSEALLADYKKMLRRIETKRASVASSESSVDITEQLRDAAQLHREQRERNKLQRQMIDASGGIKSVAQLRDETIETAGDVNEYITAVQGVQLDTGALHTAGGTGMGEGGVDDLMDELEQELAQEQEEIMLQAGRPSTHTPSERAVEQVTRYRKPRARLVPDEDDDDRAGGEVEDEDAIMARLMDGVRNL